MTPSRWRGGGWADGRVCRGQRPLAVRAGAVRIAVTREPVMDLLFMRGRGDFGRVAPPLWERFMSAVRALGLVGQPLLFMGLDDPGIVGPARCRMDACVQLPAAFGAALSLPPPLLHKRIPARWVATLQFDGPAEDIASQRLDGDADAVAAAVGVQARDRPVLRALRPGDARRPGWPQRCAAETGHAGGAARCPEAAARRCAAPARDRTRATFIRDKRCRNGPPHGARRPSQTPAATRTRARKFARSIRYSARAHQCDRSPRRHDHDAR